MKELAARPLVGMLAAAAPVVLPTTAGADGLCGDPGRPAVHLLPGGGFLSAEPEALRTECERLAGRGYRVRVVEYPTGAYDYPAVREFVPRGAIVVGFSAGGTYALHLAARGWVQKAIALAPAVAAGQQVTADALLAVLGQEMPRIPAHRVTRLAAPALILIDPRDQWIDYGATRAYVRKHRSVRIIRADSPTPDRHSHVPASWLRYVVRESATLIQRGSPRRESFGRGQ